jgi:hypothetical protein
LLPYDAHLNPRVGIKVYNSSSCTLVLVSV